MRHCITRMPDTPQAIEALKLSKSGFEVGPLNGKAPFTPATKNMDGTKNKDGGFYTFTDDEQQIARWWTQWPTANIGARPWPWAVVTDIDVKGGGLQLWERLNEGHTLPKTLVTRTGSGGFHYWWRLPYKAPMVGNIGGCIDIKHHGGCLVMPTSIHPDTRGEYTYHSWVDPEDIPELPVHLRRHVFQVPKPVPQVIPHRRRVPDNGGNLVRMVLNAEEGSRNHTFNRAVYTAALRGIPVLDELMDAAHEAGLDEAEILATFHSAKTAGEKATGKKKVAA